MAHDQGSMGEARERLMARHIREELEGLADWTIAPAALRFRCAGRGDVEAIARAIGAPVKVELLAEDIATVATAGRVGEVDVLAWVALERHEVEQLGADLLRDLERRRAGARP